MMDRYLYIKDASGKDIKISRLILGGSSLADGYLSGKVKSDSPDFVRSLTSFSRRGYESKSNREILKRAEELSLRKRVSLPSLALSYVLSQDFPSACIVSMSSIKRIKDNLQAFVR